MATQKEKNIATIEALKKADSEMNSVHKIINVFHVYEKNSLKPLIDRLGKINYNIVTDGAELEYNKRKYYLVEAELNVVPSIDNITNITDSCMEAIYGLQEIEYDGWYTEVINKIN